MKIKDKINQLRNTGLLKRIGKNRYGVILFYIILTSVVATVIAQEITNTISTNGVPSKAETPAVEKPPVVSNSKEEIPEPFLVASDAVSEIITVKKEEPKKIVIEKWKNLKHAIDEISKILNVAVNYGYMTESDMKLLDKKPSLEGEGRLAWTEVLGGILNPEGLGFYLNSGVLYIMDKERVDTYIRRSGQTRLDDNHTLIASVNFNNIDLKTALDKIQKEVGATFIYGFMNKNDLRTINDYEQLLEEENDKALENEEYKPQVISPPPLINESFNSSVEWRILVKAILSPLGYDIFEQDGVVEIRNKEEVAKLNIEKNLVREIVPIHYANPEDVIKKILELNILTPNIGRIFSSTDTSSESKIVKSGDSTDLDRTAIEVKLIVVDVFEKVALVEKWIKRLDESERQVMVKVKIFDMSGGENSSLGLRWFSQIGDSQIEGMQLGLGNVSYGSGSTSISKTEETQQWNSQNQLTPIETYSKSIIDTADSLKSAILGPVSVSAILEAIESDKNSKMLSEPLLVIGNRTQSTIDISKDYPYLRTESNISGDSGTVTYSYNWETVSVGLDMTILPEISPDGNQVRLTLSPDLSSYEGEAVAPDKSTYPIISTRKFDTRVIVPNGDSLILGGLAYTSSSLNESSIPILGKIPLLGRLFRYKSDSKEQNNLVIIITPVILDEKMPETGFEVNMLKEATSVTANGQSAFYTTNDLINAMQEPELGE